MNAPAKAIDLAVTAVRLPITAAEAVVGESTVASFPPVRVLTAAQVWMLESGGIVFDDDRLTARASLLRAALDRRAEADALEAQAERVRSRGTELAEARQEEAETLRTEAAKAANAQRKRIAAGATARKQAAKRTVGRKAAVVDRVDQQRRQRLAADERAAKRAALAGERRALAAEKKAVDTKRKARDLEDGVQAAKTQRRNSRKRS
jgi:hypothetical protein